MEQARVAILLLKNSPNPDVNTRSIVDAARFFCEKFHDTSKVLPLAEYAAEFVQRKRSENLRQPTVNEIQRFMAEFVADFPNQLVTEFSPEQAEVYLTKTKPVNRNRKAVLNQFFNYLAQTAQTTNRRVRVLTTTNPIRLIPRQRSDERDMSGLKILNVKEVHSLLKRAASFNAQRLFVWLLFTGMRPAEAVKFWGIGSKSSGEQTQLGWNAINLRAKVIHVPPSVSKTRTNRKIRIQPNLAKWLKHYRGQSFLTKNWRDKFGWSKDVLDKSKRRVSDICRHTFISYLVSIAEGWRDMELQAGNTKEVQLKHYLDLVHDNPADYWNITPDRVGVFDVTEVEYAKRGYLNRKRAILKNRLKIRHNRNGERL
jgi:integrase